MVWLDHNRIGDVGAQRLVSAQASNAIIEKIHLDKNNGISVTAKRNIRDVQKIFAKKDGIIAEQAQTIALLRKDNSSKEEEILSWKNAIALLKRDKSLKNSSTSADSDPSDSSNENRVSKRFRTY